MAFLQKLRQANIFRPNPATDRPFGMPDTDSGINLQEIASLSSALDDQALRRQKELMGFGLEQRMQQERLAQVAQNARMSQSLNPTAPKKNVVYGGTEGFSPMQKQFRQDDLIKNEREFEKQQLSDNFTRRQDELRQKRDDSEFMFNKELAGRKDIANLDLERAVKLRGVDKQAQAERDRFMAEQQMNRDRFGAEQRRQDIITREQIQGEEARKTNAERPVTPTQGKADFANRAQELAIQYPQVAPFLTKDEATGQIRIADNATPEQAKWIQDKLGMGASSTPQGRGNAPGKMIQRNKKTGAMRESTDGGKTWKEVKK